VIAWWGWVLIWFALVLLLLGVLAYCVWRLFQRFMVLQRDLFELTAKVAILDGVAAATEERPLNAVLQESKAVRRAFAARIEHRRTRKFNRRRARMERAKLITSVDATSVDSFTRRNHKEVPHEHG
jgi:hypothetical protein